MGQAGKRLCQLNLRTATPVHYEVNEHTTPFAESGGVPGNIPASGNGAFTSQAALPAFVLLRRARNVTMPKPAANSGSAAGSGTGAS
jgi:hypothetical protein